MLISASDYSGGIALSRVPKEGRPIDLFSVDLRSADPASADAVLVDQGRRDFLIRCCHGQHPGHAEAQKALEQLPR